MTGEAQQLQVQNGEHESDAFCWGWSQALWEISIFCTEWYSGRSMQGIAV